MTSQYSYTRRTSDSAAVEIPPLSTGVQNKTPNSDDEALRTGMCGMSTDDGERVRDEGGAVMRRKARRKKRRSKKLRRIDGGSASDDGCMRESHEDNTRLDHRSSQRQQPKRKLFVGQLPGNVTEGQLRALFEPFGHISQLTICRDRNTGESQRCCFVTFVRSTSALDACKTLHNAVCLPGMMKPLQVKFAEFVSNLRQRKIFVGKLSKHLVEDDLIEMFRVFGEIDDCTVIREPINGYSKGCAFITYMDKSSATAAIENMHNSRLMPGCPTPVVVKLADSRAAKESKLLTRQLRCEYTASVNLHVPVTVTVPAPLIPFNQFNNSSLASLIPAVYLHSSTYLHGNESHRPTHVSTRTSPSCSRLSSQSNPIGLDMCLNRPLTTAPVILPICHYQQLLA